MTLDRCAMSFYGQNTIFIGALAAGCCSDNLSYDSPGRAVRGGWYEPTDAEQYGAAAGQNRATVLSCVLL